MNLRSRIYDATDLVKVYRPPNLHSVMPGNKVMLLSGGPKMTVCDVDTAGRAICQWESNGTLHSRAFDLKVLTCWGAQ